MKQNWMMLQMNAKKICKRVKLTDKELISELKIGYASNLSPLLKQSDRIIICSGSNCHTIEFNLDCELIEGKNKLSATIFD